MQHLCFALTQSAIISVFSISAGENLAQIFLSYLTALARKVPHLDFLFSAAIRFLVGFRPIGP